MHSNVWDTTLAALIRKVRRLTTFVRHGEFIEALALIAMRLHVPLPPPTPLPRPPAARRAHTSARPKVVACVHALTLDGAPISLFEILCGLARTSRYDVELISASDGPLHERAREHGIPVHIVASPQNDSVGGRGYDRGVAAFANALIALQPDVVIANSIVSFHAVDAARIAGVPSLWLIREADPPRAYFARFPRAVQRRALACLVYPQRTIFVSRSIQQAWPSAGAPIALIRTVPDRAAIEELQGVNRADARAALSLTDDDFVMLCVGTLCENKGQLDLLAALAAPPLAGARVRLLLVGAVAEPGGQAVLRAFATLPPELRDRVEIHPATPAVGTFYAAADVYTCCSRSEGYPRTILEALAVGLPVVTTSVGGIPEALEGTQVRRYPPGDPIALAQALHDLADSPALRASMSASSRRRWTTLAAGDDMIDAYARAIDSACGTPGSAAP